MHNTLMRFTAECVRLCLIFRIPMTGENPRSSRFWLLPACPMSFAGVFLSLEKLLPYQCLGSKRVCANSADLMFPWQGNLRMAPLLQPLPSTIPTTCAACWRPASWIWSCS